MRQRAESGKKAASVSSTVKFPKIEKLRPKEIKLAEHRRSQRQLKTHNIKRPKALNNSKLNTLQGQRPTGGLDLKVSRYAEKQILQHKNNLKAKAFGVYGEDLKPLIGTAVHISEVGGEEKRPIASITKWMTLYTGYRLAQRFQLTISGTYFRVSTTAGNAAGTSAELEPKDWVTIEDLFYALMLPSGNDSALTLAQNFGAFLFYENKGEGKALKEVKSLDITQDRANLGLYTSLFVEQMNNLAAELGMVNTVYANPHGLDDETAHSTVKDICLLAKATGSIPSLSRIISTRNHLARIKISVGKKNTQFRELEWTNTNRLLWKKGYQGGKTGQTVGAGNCLACIYSDQKRRLFIVVLGCPGRQDRFNDTELLVRLCCVGEGIGCVALGEGKPETTFGGP